MHFKRQEVISFNLSTAYTAYTIPCPSFDTQTRCADTHKVTHSSFTPFTNKNVCHICIAQTDDRRTTGQTEYFHVLNICRVVHCWSVACLPDAIAERMIRTRIHIAGLNKKYKGVRLAPTHHICTPHLEWMTAKPSKCKKQCVPLTGA